jgi:hypothetical protein
MRHRGELARAYPAAVAAPVTQATTNEAVRQIVPMTTLREHALNAPDDPGACKRRTAESLESGPVSAAHALIRLWLAANLDSSTDELVTTTSCACRS